MTDMRDRQSWLERLTTDGFVELSPDGLRLTPRWHAALARAAYRGYVDGSGLDDIRAPIAAALIESYGDQDELVLAVGISAILPLVLAEMAPQPVRSGAW